MRSILPSLLLTATFAVAVLRLPPLHPLQIWSGSWAIAATLYALKLLPYRDISWLTVAMICGATISFALGVFIGDRIVGRRDSRWRSTQPRVALDRAAQTAARISLLIGAVLLAAFLAQISLRYGVVNALRVSRNVRLALVDGQAPKTFLYARFAAVAVVLCSLAAVSTDERSSRRRWLLLSACAAVSLYFSTGRQLLIDALLGGVTVFILASPTPVVRRRVAAVAAAMAAVSLLIFIGVGTVIGNTYQTNSESKFDNFFSRHPTVAWMAPAYAHASAPIPALDAAVHFTKTWGRAFGCATAQFECRMLRHVGLNVNEEPPASPFTQWPLPWNTYTFLGSLLEDGGTALVLLLVALCGLPIGALWSLHRSGSAYGTVAYAFSVPVMLWAYRQNLLDTEAGAAVVAVGLLWIASRRRVLVSAELLQSLIVERARPHVERKW